MTAQTIRLGELMGIADLPADYAGFERLLEDYEVEHFAFVPGQPSVVALDSMRILEATLPSAVRPLVRRVSLALLDDALLEALGLPRQPAWLRGGVRRALRLRARVLRHLVGPRRAPYAHDPSRTYPGGYTLSMLGPTHLGGLDPRSPTPGCPVPHPEGGAPTAPAAPAAPDSHRTVTGRAGRAPGSPG